jgi:hypothetical protein
VKKTAATISFVVALVLLGLAVNTFQSEYQRRDYYQKTTAAHEERANMARTQAIGSRLSADFEKFAAEEDAASNKLRAEQTAAEITYSIEAVIGSAFLIAGFVLWSKDGKPIAKVNRA